MGIFSGDSKSSTTNSDDDLNVTSANYADGTVTNNTFADTNTVSGGKKSTINVTQTDHGTVKTSHDLSIKSLDFAESALDNVTDLTERAGASMSAFAMSASKTPIEKQDNKSLILIGVVLAGAGLLVFLTGKK